MFIPRPSAPDPRQCNNRDMITNKSEHFRDKNFSKPAIAVSLFLESVRPAYIALTGLRAKEPPARQPAEEDKLLAMQVARDAVQVSKGLACFPVLVDWRVEEVVFGRVDVCMPHVRVYIYPDGFVLAQQCLVGARECVDPFPDWREV